MFDDVREIERKASVAAEQRKQDGQAIVKSRMNALFDVLAIPLEERAYYMLDAQYLRQHGEAYINKVGEPEQAAATIEVVPERKRLH